ncbi:NAD(P)-dependent oxidoreductase, partial [Burkholderia pseudomallei]
AVMPFASWVQEVLRLGAGLGLAQADFGGLIDFVRPQAMRGA